MAAGSGQSVIGYFQAVNVDQTIGNGQVTDLSTRQVGIANR